MIAPPTAPVDRHPVGGVPFSVMPLSEAIELVTRLGQNGPTAWRDSSELRGVPGVSVHFANAYSIALADSDPSYAEQLGAGDLVFTDGVPVAWAGRRLHGVSASQWERVYGPDVMTGVLARSDATGPRHYLLGGEPAALTALAAAITRRWPKAKVVGSESPPFRPPTPAELAARDRRIVDSGATLVWVGLGTPKQDVETQRLARSLPVTALAVGAAFDFIAGTKKQAPVWAQRSGTEWAFRLASEPTRLSRRYLWGNPRFVLAVVRHRRVESSACASASGRPPAERRPQDVVGSGAMAPRGTVGHE